MSLLIHRAPIVASPCDHLRPTFVCTSVRWQIRRRVPFLTRILQTRISLAARVSNYCIKYIIFDIEFAKCTAGHESEAKH